MEYNSAQWLAIDDLKRDVRQLDGMLVASAKFERLARTIAQLGPYQSTVLIQGESGTGKDIVAHALHRGGPNPAGPFVIFNCSNLVDTLAESQLFGHVKGAFTDAREDSIGYFRSADGGTLFLDEVGELPPLLQPKLLRAVETHEVQPVGSARSYRVSIRLIAATNRDLSRMVTDGSFRPDLYYRMNATPLILPPLREQREAIGAFIAHFVEQCNQQFGKRVEQISARALELLSNYEWPGNFRELRHAIENATMLTENGRIDADLIPEPVSGAGSEAAPNGANHPSWLTSGNGLSGELRGNRAEASYSLNDAIQIALVRALRKADGNCHQAAKLLGVSRYTVYRMMTRYGLGQVRDYRGVNGALDAGELV